MHACIGGIISIISLVINYFQQYNQLAITNHWKSGQCLVWDFTCVDTFAASYISDATREARAVATAAEARKKEKYALLSKSHHFVPVAIETSGALGPDALSLLTDISRRQQSITHDHQSLPFLLQRVSIALQQGNAASVMGTTSSV